jgi:Asp-tRNA(Asn)/Glu-tRNA(Gln) amidotransferase A subunit family amidase
MAIDSTYDRRAFMGYFATIGLGSTLLPGVLWAQQQQQGTPITKEMLASAEQIAGIEFTDDERAAIVNSVGQLQNTMKQLHAMALPNSVFPAYVFDPIPPGQTMPKLAAGPTVREKIPVMARPSSLDELAYAGVAQLSQMVHARKVKPSELTELYLGRLKKYDPQLHFVINLTEERARAQARQLDSEASLGKFRGPLHGIPWGAKDLLSVKGYPTTWGAGLYKEQSFDTDATVVKRLDDAGAILVAKLTLGALAQGDVWFGERTRNPWEPSTGSSGSSAGPGSAVSSGCVPFALGTETQGSITSPSTVNAITGHRPTFGRVPRTGAMALSWTMDKIGPMTRSAEDCALVFAAIQGPDNFDRAIKDVPFNWNATTPLSKLRIAYFEPQGRNGAPATLNDITKSVIDSLERQGAKLKMIPPPPQTHVFDSGIILDAECAAAFQPDTLNGKIKELETPRPFVTPGRNGYAGYSTWPGTFRSGEFIPAVEYINAMRARTTMMQDWWDLFKDVDVIVTTNEPLGVTNLTGTPCVAAPTAMYVPQPPQGRGGGGAPSIPVTDTTIRPPRPARPGNVRFLGALYRDDLVLRVANAFQSNTNFHKERPPQFP